MKPPTLRKLDAASRTTSVALLLCCGLAAGCGAKDAAPTQSAARVNKEEITIHQIGAALSSQQLKPEQVPAAERQVLEKLIGRELAVQKAADLKLDRDPKVVQAIESARRDIIARAYADKIADGAGRPSEAEIKQYYESHPALFAERKVYQLDEFAITADPGQIDALKAALPSLRSTDEVTAHLRTSGLKFTSGQVVRAAEQVPLPMLPALSRLSEGQAMLTSGAGGAQVVVLKSVRMQPVDEARAARAIEQFLLNERRRKLIADDMNTLRAAAKIEYQGRFAASAPAEAARAVTAADASAPAATALDAKPVNDEPAPGAASTPTSAAASGIDASIVNKGLGLK